jgi:hypothetical protein
LVLATNSTLASMFHKSSVASSVTGMPEHEDLIGRDRNAQHHQDGDQDFQVEGKRAH